MFAYYFPPSGGGGVQRTAKYVKYLPAEGFDSIVVAGGRRGFFLRDTSLNRDVPTGTAVRRAGALPLQQAQWKLDGLLRRGGLPTQLVKEALWPDSLVGWLPGAVLHGLRAVRTHRPDVIYSTSLPITGHLAALIIQRITGLPWVADFRDGWTLDPFGPTSPSDAPLARARAWLERKLIAEASYVTVVDESIHLLGLPDNDPKRVVIRNGVDLEDVALKSVTDATGSSEGFRLSHVGSFYGTRNAAPVFEAIRDLIGRGKLDPSNFELRIVGHADFSDAKLDSLPVTIAGYVDHERAVTEMTSATALLFYQPLEQRGSSGKIYEYLTSGRPVLAVAHRDNLGSRLVDQLGAGICAEPDDHTGISDAIERMVLDWQQGSLRVDASVRDEALRRFSRRKLTGDLAAVFRSAITEARPLAERE